MNHCYQIIHSDTNAVIHEYHFGVLTRGDLFPIEELPERLESMPSSFVKLATLYTTNLALFHESGETARRIVFLKARNRALMELRDSK